MLQIKNYKLAFLAFLLMILFCYLGNWQLNRSEQKKSILAAFNQRTLSKPLTNTNIDFNTDLRFYRVELTGQFDNEHTMLLDNKVNQGKVGYEVYTLFNTTNNLQLLVDRGFVSLGSSRDILPNIPAINGLITIKGIFNTSPGYVKWGNMIEDNHITWPLRIEYLDIPELKQRELLPTQLANLVVMLEAKDPAAYAVNWQLINMTPEKHLGYAIQWFALAFTLLILFVALNCKFTKNKTTIKNPERTN